VRTGRLRFRHPPIIAEPPRRRPGQVRPMGVLGPLPA
jgi:hypothetical protein